MEQVKSESSQPAEQVDQARKPYQQPQLQTHGKVEQITHMPAPPTNGSNGVPV